MQDVAVGIDRVARPRRGARDCAQRHAGANAGLTQERARYIEQQLVAGDPAQALLDVVGPNPANLIVVGNRGLGASEGQRLGSVPGNVVKNALCDVLVVQTSALDEDRVLGEQLVQPAADQAGPVTEADPGG